MPVYTVQGPDGRTYTIEGPPGATADQLGAVIQSQQAAAPRMQDFGGAPKKSAAQIGFEQEAKKLSPLMAGVVRAGAAAEQTVAGLKDLFGYGDSPEKQAERQMAIGAVEEASPKAALAGNLLANAGMAYLGGTALKGLGAVGSAANLAKTGRVLSAAGKAVTAPTGLKEAAAGGALYSGLTEQGDLGDRLGSAGLGALGGTVGYGVGKGIGAAGTALANKAKQVAGSVASRFGDVQKTAVSEALEQAGLNASKMSAANQEAIANAFQQAGVAPQDLGAQTRGALQKMANQANKSGGTLDPAALQRMADYEALKIKPLSGWVSRTPEEWNAGHTLQGVNPDITQRWAEANQALVNRIQGAAPADVSDYAAGSALRESIQKPYEAMKGAAGQLYEQYRAMGGHDLPLDAAALSQNVAADLKKNLITKKLPSDVRGWLSGVTSGKEPLTFGTGSEQMAALNGLIYSTQDKAERKALGIVKSHLEDALSGANLPEAPGAEQAALSGAFKKARGAASEYFGLAKSSPLAEAVTTGKFTPEKLPDMMKSLTVDNLGKMIEADARFGTDSLGKLRDAASIFIRDSAVLQGETGGKFTVNGLRKALDAIGPEKGVALFGPEGWGQYQQALRAGGAMMNEPSGVVSAKSGTAQAMMNMMQKFAPTALALPIKGVQAVQRAAEAQSLLSGVPKQQTAGLLPGAREAMQQTGISPLGLLGYYYGASAAAPGAR